MKLREIALPLALNLLSGCLPKKPEPVEAPTPVSVQCTRFSQQLNDIKHIKRWDTEKLTKELNNFEVFSGATWVNPNVGGSKPTVILVEDLHGQKEGDLERLRLLKKHLHIPAVALEGWDNETLLHFNAEEDLVRKVIDDPELLCLGLEDNEARVKAYLGVLLKSYVELRSQPEPTFSDDPVDVFLKKALEQDLATKKREVRTGIVGIYQTKGIPIEPFNLKETQITPILNEAVQLCGFSDYLTFNEAVKTSPAQIETCLVTAHENFEKWVLEDRNFLAVDRLDQALQNNHGLSAVALWFGQAHSDALQDLLNEKGYPVVVVPLQRENDTKVGDPLDELLNER